MQALKPKIPIKAPTNEKGGEDWFGVANGKMSESQACNNHKFS